MFWEIEKHSDGVRLCYGRENHHINYDELSNTVDAIEKSIASEQKLLVALFCNNSPAAIAAYLATLRSGHALMLLSDSLDLSLREQIIQNYRPEFVISTEPKYVPTGYLIDSFSESLYIAIALNSTVCASIHPETAVLLSTSGTTGSPKFVRLSYRNVQSNAESITEYLGITKDETTITSLPISYSYGFSVLNSHLLAGASIVCTDASVVSKDFWQLFRENRCTSFAGVPYSYLMLERLRFGKMELPTLRTLTQAGGRLSADKLQLFAEISKHRNYRFFVMYGQTEASPRISYVPHDRLLEKTTSVGIPIPGGDIQILGDYGLASEVNIEGEILYRGPNVMLGYAMSRDDLAKGDEECGVLHTGDIGYKDAEGYLFITGRLKRFIKIFGLRLNMDDIERMLENTLSTPVACVGWDDNILLLVESLLDTDIQEAKRRTVELYQIHHSAVQVFGTKSLPVTSAGKKDYSTIEKELKVHENS